MSKEIEHTKREWKVTTKPKEQVKFFDGFTLYVESDNLLIALCDREDWDRKEERQANAQLIAAAPELYEVCKIALEIFVSFDVRNKIVSGVSLQLNEALAKAEGKHDN